jgi:N-acetylneuraminate synthase/N,N'-diacetyllegionaminate synthase
MTRIPVGSRWLGDGEPCFVAAEIGVNHNGDLELAHKMIDAAADAGADGVKFQNYRTEDFLSDQRLTYEYVVDGRRVIESQFDMFKRYELPPDTLHRFREHCDDRGVVFFSTPTSSAGIADLVSAGAPLLKNGSDLLTHLPLIRAMAETGLPTVLSTGMATTAEIDDAVRAFRSAGGTALILLHCTSSYPTPDEDVHLRKIPTLARLFGCPVGFSDHTDGIVAAIGARVLGACFVEKHFTLDKTMAGPDHAFSASPAELRALVDGVRRVERNLGCQALGPTATEQASRRDFRVSCVATRDLDSGAVLGEADVALRRPGTGLPAAALDWIVGRRLGRAVTMGSPLVPGDFL